MKKNSHVVWVCPTNDLFFRSKGSVKCRPTSVLPKLTEHGYRLSVLIPFDPTLLPKTKLAPTRTFRATVHLLQDYSVQFTRLTKGLSNPSIFMVKLPPLETALANAVFAKSAIVLAEHLKKAVDIFHVFEWNASLVPLFLELEKSQSALFRNTKTFLNVSRIGSDGCFAPAILSHLGLPDTLFHPDGVEFYGQISFLKSGLLFSDGVGLIDGRNANGAMNNRTRVQLQGVFDAQAHKLRRWASMRSVKMFLETYRELLSMPKPKPLLPSLLKRLRTNQNAVQNFVDSWGPLPRERYRQNQIGFLFQAPRKAYAFWEWSGEVMNDYGVLLDWCGKKRTVLARGVGAFGEFWVEVHPDQEYIIELVGWDANGQMRTLLKSAKMRTPRDSASPNTDAIFLDVRTRRRFHAEANQLWNVIKLGASESLGFSPGKISSSSLAVKS